ncbi:malate and lactate dehydrogenase [Holotrichia oblita]|uniref:Malate and lactate dehydrogenase n=1 Tax=Holotrichia oblita TaxID=644536 RepID=A0ACB9SWV3_HOLOL|nr:malate and lactate dehydrogenase [Holotrichia oblita]
MLGRLLHRSIKAKHIFARNLSLTHRNDFKVTVIGGVGGIGAPLCLLLKLQPDLITELYIQDLVKWTPGVALDISHINTPVKVKAFTGADQVREACRGTDLVIIPGGVPRKPGMTRDDLFGANASVVRDVAVACADACPDALINIITNPVNSVVPIFCEVMRKAGKLNPAKIFGISTLDLVRSSTFVANLKGLDPSKVVVPSVGGHSGISIVPLLSQCQPQVSLTPDEIKTLTTNIQQAGTNVVKAKVGAGSAQLAMAFAGARFAFNLLRAKKGESNIIECAFTLNNSHGTKYISSRLLLGKNGIEKDLGIGKLSDFEQENFKKAIEAIKKNVAKGEQFVNKIGDIDIPNDEEQNDNEKKKKQEKVDLAVLNGEKIQISNDNEKKNIDKNVLNEEKRAD